ncbi:hypothetical protein [Aquimarina sp. 2201CG5-10]|uniref:hypothetical protein n=1 Tax=Aquimarina callyspongiae TaxID=3098150 RepID=UPI002AB4BA48|nr:hypothetical protein [Aquimarina sp. 2201CG5-10]MDY8134105.1 hypothetical protein [Aquimarina sp. 2201CG5-10]
MAQDIRELLKQDRQIPSENIRNGHQDRFMARLEKELPKKSRSLGYSWLRIAASVVVILSVSFMAINQFGKNSGENPEVVESTVKNSTVILPKQSSSLAEISPEYEKVENSILTSIKFQLSQITIDDRNRELVESFMIRLDKLDKEYQKLNKELIEVGPNVQSVEAMMENLTMRLTLLNRLNDKLKELESIENEHYNEIQA